MRGDAHALHQRGKRLRGEVPLLLEVRMDARKRGMGVDAEDRIVIHAQHRQIVGHAHVSFLAHPKDRIGTVVV